MYLSRPPINGKSHNAKPQSGPKPMTINNPSSGEQKTTVMIADDSVRHPVTQTWTRAYQNTQTTTKGAPESKTTNGGRFTAGKRKGP